MKKLPFAFASIVILGIIHCGSASEREPAPQELQSFGVAYVARGASTGLLDSAGNEVGAVTTAAGDTRVVWKGDALRLRWTDASLTVLENDREIARADSSGPSPDSVDVFHSRIDAILVGGIVSRERGENVPWLPAIETGETITTQDDTAMMLEESSDCHAASCSAWDYTTAYNCSIGSAYNQCTMSGGGCSRDGSPDCSCGWFSCTCTATFCH